jgi:hypothetical protein
MVGWGRGCAWKARKQCAVALRFIYSDSSIHGVAAVDWDQIDPPNDTYCALSAEFRRRFARFEALQKFI